jgi:hypothetical protein
MPEARRAALISRPSSARPGSGAPATPAFIGWIELVAALAKEGLPALVAALPDALMYRNRVGLRVVPALHDAAFIEQSLASFHAAVTAPRTSWGAARRGRIRE